MSTRRLADGVGVPRLDLARDERADALRPRHEREAVAAAPARELDGAVAEQPARPCLAHLQAVDGRERHGLQRAVERAADDDQLRLGDGETPCAPTPTAAAAGAPGRPPRRRRPPRGQASSPRQRIPSRPTIETDDREPSQSRARAEEGAGEHGAVGPRAHEDVLVRGRRGRTASMPGGSAAGAGPATHARCRPTVHTPTVEAPAPPAPACAGTCGVRLRVGSAHARGAVDRRRRPLLLGGCTQHAAAIGYRVLFSLAPLAIVLVSIVGLVLQDDEVRRRTSSTRSSTSSPSPPTAGGEDAVTAVASAGLVLGARGPRRLRVDGVRDDGLRAGRPREYHERRAAGRPPAASSSTCCWWAGVLVGSGSSSAPLDFLRAGGPAVPQWLDVEASRTS